MLRAHAALCHAALAVLVSWVGLVWAGCTRNVDATRALGAPCASNGECSNLCLPPAFYPGGFCSRMCHVDSDCPVGSQCAPNDVCLFSCFDDQDCSLLVDGWSCRDLDGKLVCAPDNLELPDAGTSHDAP